MDYIESIQPIKRIYYTGESPVLIDCSDYQTRVCKYSRSTSSAFKLICEIVGSTLAEIWQLNAPKCDLVKIKYCHVPSGFSLSWFDKPCIGSVLINNVVDINPNSISSVAHTPANLISLLEIALFDFWIANEDRNANNSNLMYNVEDKEIIPIDFGCIFNSTTFDYPLAQLTSTDTILYSELFKHLSSGLKSKYVQKLEERISIYYHNSLQKSKVNASNIMEKIPAEWNISTTIIENKLNELFTTQWINEVWANFIENIENNLH